MLDTPLTTAYNALARSLLFKYHHQSAMHLAYPHIKCELYKSYPVARWVKPEGFNLLCRLSCCGAQRYKDKFILLGNSNKLKHGGTRNRQINTGNTTSLPVNTIMV
jgi:hypothetical protein